MDTKKIIILNAPPLFLDDIRDVQHAFLHGEQIELERFSGIPRGSWDIVRSYDEFVKSIKERGIPTHVSFDNDLCENHYKLFIKASNEGGFFDWKFANPKMGLHALQFLINHCKENGVATPIIYIHSANSLARAEMKKMIENAKEQQHYV